ncbi:hypothetical protein M422DRAFT_258721 [Sphaerobolus stellatus SS14]|uniref:Uncharacterized protein n=1 Tax=Sphaerobolus stellatus (strain SS14) TaxID=990650 RepID=A0A0C9VLB0_SPHS4|nr:hypothetical protein M422DRAFT_258721 [Sphaerobolus stellatus SS14]
MKVDSSTSPVSVIQAFHSDPSTEWVIESTPGFVAIKHKMGCPICDTSMSHCMAAKQAYKICHAEKDISKAVVDAWPELGRYQDDYYCLLYYCLLEDYNVLDIMAQISCVYPYGPTDPIIPLLYLSQHNVLKEFTQSAKKKAEEATIKNLDDQVQSLEKQLQETKDNSAKLSKHEELILENKHLQRELEYYQGRVQYTLYSKDAHWVIQNGYCLSDIPASDSKDDNKDLAGLPTLPDEIPQNIPSCPPTRLACPVSKTSKNISKVVQEAGIPAIGGTCTSSKQTRIITDPPVSITGVLPKPLGRVRAE